MTTETLGRFGHHPDHAIDFCVEVEAIEGEIADIAAGLTPTMNLDERIAKAMTFRVGGDAPSIASKTALRAIEASRRAEVAPKVSEKDINRWHDTIQQRPEGPWTLGCGGSFDRTTINPISDEMMAELAQWLRMGYTPWNGRSMPLSPGDRQFMYMLYYSVQGLIARMRAAEKLDCEAAEPVAREEFENGVNAWLDNQHPDDAAVDAFAGKMRRKMAASREKGHGGWNDKTQCSAADLSAMLRAHVEKGDPVDVANFAMMLGQRGERIAPTDSQAGRDAVEADCHGLDTAERVRFYEHDFYPLSNFSAFRVTGWGRDFDTSEHAYHWHKFPDRPDIQDNIQCSPSAHEAFKYAESMKPFRRPDWDDVKVGFMRAILHAKAAQHEYVRRKLLATGDRELVEDSWRDDFWGWGPNRDGRNMLGKLWMEVRAELRAALSTPRGRAAE